MSLAKKLQLKGPVQVLNDPGVDLDDVEPAEHAPDMLGFVHQAADLAGIEAVLQAARADHIAWIAYPKAGQLGTDLNRDKLWAALEGKGVRPVRQVSIDEVWSALRFRFAGR